MRKLTAFLMTMMLLLTMFSTAGHASGNARVKLGNEVLFDKYLHLVAGKKVGLITNQTGVNSKGESVVDVFARSKDFQLVALYSPEHGLDGIAKAGEYVESYTHPQLKIPVYSLYGKTRKPTKEMLANVDVLVFDMQDIGARSYTYMSTMNYCMVAAAESKKPIIILDRPNPVGGMIVEGPILENPYISFVGIDNLPKAHGMTAGELARFFNRKINANLTIVPMEGYSRDMIFQDTGLPFVQTSPNIPDIQSLFGYMATGLGEGTGIFQADKFKWIGGQRINSDKYAELLNKAGLPGVRFIPETRGLAGGVRLEITNYHTFNPAKTGIYALTYAHSLTKFNVPKSGQTVVMFDKIMGTNKIGQYLEQGLTPQQIEAKYAADLNKFKQERGKYLIYGTSDQVKVLVNGQLVFFDVFPFVDKNNRVMVPLRAIGEALGAQIQWHPHNKSISINKGQDSIILQINSNRAIVNGQVRAMDTVPQIKDQRTLVPVRFVSEFLGATVGWDLPSRTVEIN